MAKIAILVNHVTTYNGKGWTPNDVMLSGTEEGIVQWSKRLVKLGHEVTVFQNGFIGENEGVKYQDRKEYPEVAQYYDVTWNHKALDMPIIGKTYYFTTETNADRLDLSKYDGVVWPSQWAKDNIRVNNPNVLVVNYGYDQDKIYPQAKIPKTVLYASSPDRGLDSLVKVWPQVVEAHPDAMLIVTYGAQPRDIPNAMFMGELTDDEMNTLYMESDVWCHPCNGGELFGIVAVKAQAAGCVPVYFPTMALQETVQSGLKTTPTMLADDLIRMLGDNTLKEAIREDLATKTYPTWDSTTQDLLRLC